MIYAPGRMELELLYESMGHMHFPEKKRIALREKNANYS
jgi:hypothetical protein